MSRTRAEYLEDVRRPGKFEGEQPYVPYYWEVFLNGGADHDDGKVLGFDVTPEDFALFPELAGKQTVSLIERDDGFVCEV